MPNFTCHDVQNEQAIKILRQLGAKKLNASAIGLDLRDGKVVSDGYDILPKFLSTHIEPLRSTLGTPGGMSLFQRALNDGRDVTTIKKAKRYNPKGVWITGLQIFHSPGNPVLLRDSNLRVSVSIDEI